MTTQLVVATTAYALATVAAAIDAGLFGPARRVLVLANTTSMPEAAPRVDEVAGWDQLAARFDVVVDYNAAIEPQHPAAWQPRSADLTLWERYFRDRWGLGEDDLHLVVETVHTGQALALCRIFADAVVDVYADGLMSYGPTRTALPDTVGCRVERLLHLDLVPGLAPVLLSEWPVAPVVVPTEAFRAVLAELTPSRPDDTRAEATVLIVGQYLSALGLVTPAAEADLYEELVRGAVRTGHRHLTFKPHPSALGGQGHRLREVAAGLGAELVVADGAELAESLFAADRVALVLGCFSTALLTARSVYGIPVAAAGTRLLLERLTPYQNSNRIPVTLVDALVPDLATLGEPGAHRRPEPADLAGLVTAVSYAMQPVLLADRRGEAVGYLSRNWPEQARYFKRRRLTRLGLPGALPPKPVPARRKPLVRRLLRQVAGAVR